MLGARRRRCGAKSHPSCGTTKAHRCTGRRSTFVPLAHIMRIFFGASAHITRMVPHKVSSFHRKTGECKTAARFYFPESARLAYNIPIMARRDKRESLSSTSGDYPAGNNDAANSSSRCGTRSAAARSACTSRSMWAVSEYKFIHPFIAKLLISELRALTGCECIAPLFLLPPPPLQYTPSPRSISLDAADSSLVSCEMLCLVGICVCACVRLVARPAKGSMSSINSSQWPMTSTFLCQGVPSDGL